MKKTRTPLALIAVSLLALANCSPKILSEGVPLLGTSDKVKVQGQYSSVAIDQVDRFKFDAGKIIIESSSGTVSVNAPPGIDKPKPGEQWALVTEGEADGKRTLTFTHEQSLDDFTIAVPSGNDGQVHYVTMAGANGEDVVIFAWGSRSSSYWGYVTVTRKS